MIDSPTPKTGRCDFPVDIVYTWVDPSDPAWRKKFLMARSGYSGSPALCRDGAGPRDPKRRDYLKYSLRSVFTYARFFRNIVIVTDDQFPPFLDPHHPRIRVVSHREVFDDPGALPTFNSHAIESRLHHIPGLAEHFIYFNDDFFLGKPVTKDHFFPDRDVSFYFPSPLPIDMKPVSSRDLAISAAAKNGRDLFEKKFRTRITQHIRHAPYALRRSVLLEMEQVIPEVFHVTGRNRFRHTSDHSVSAFLYFHYAALTEKARPGSLSSMYMDTRFRHVFRKMVFTRVLKRYHTFCINERAPRPRNPEFIQCVIKNFLRICFPEPCNHERQVKS